MLFIYTPILLKLVAVTLFFTVAATNHSARLSRFNYRTPKAHKAQGLVVQERTEVEKHDRKFATFFNRGLGWALIGYNMRLPQ